MNLVHNNKPIVKEFAYTFDFEFFSFFVGLLAIVKSENLSLYKVSKFSISYKRIIFVDNTVDLAN